jgi:butyrate kinase
MSERCPLRSGELVIGSIPEFCMTHCYEEWDRALKEQGGLFDYYDPSNDECNHDRYEVEHSHEGLNKPDESEVRNYSLVDMCGNCECELMETVYRFNCPHNKSA